MTVQINVREYRSGNQKWTIQRKSGNVCLCATGIHFASFYNLWLDFVNVLTVVFFILLLNSFNAVHPIICESWYMWKTPSWPYHFPKSEVWSIKLVSFGYFLLQYPFWAREMGGNVYVSGASVLPLSTIFLLGFKTVPTVWYVLFFY